MLERTTLRPAFWWPLLGTAGLGLSLIGPSYLADTVDGVSPLTEREGDVLRAAAEHATAGEIGSHLFLAEGTVRNYLSVAIRKVGARNRGEAIAIARDKGWL